MLVAPNGARDGVPLDAAIPPCLNHRMSGMSGKRMTLYGQHLAYSAFAALAGLPVGCLLVGLLMGAFGWLSEAGSLGDVTQVFFVAMSIAVVAMLIGLLPALLYGVPFYAWLSYRQWANGFTALGAGLLPGLAVMPFDADIAVFVLIFGAAVALCTHGFAWRRLARLRRTEASGAPVEAQDGGAV